MNLSLSLKRRNTKRILFNALKLLLVGWLAVFLLLPLIFKFSHTLRSRIFFLNFVSIDKAHSKVSYPSHIDLSRPETLGLYATRNFYLSYSDTDENKVKIGVWQIIPNYIVKQFHRELKIRSKFARNLTILSDNQTKLQHIILDDKFDLNNYRQKESFFEEIIRKSNDPIVIYFHGNTGTRANGHRVELYGQLRKMEYHIFAIDYRGFADSSEQSPTEKGCVSDALAIYKYIKNLTKNPIYIYGHALGTGISLHMVSIISKHKSIDDPNGVILESPFNNVKGDEREEGLLSTILKNTPWHESTVSKPIYDNGFRFESNQHISEFRAPVLVLHSESEHTAPPIAEEGYDIFLKALEMRNKSSGPVELHRFDEKYGHKYLVRAPYFTSIIQKFIGTYRHKTY